MLASPIPLQTYDPLLDVKAALPGTDTEALLEPVKDPVDVPLCACQSVASIRELLGPNDHLFCVRIWPASNESLTREDTTVEELQSPLLKTERQTSSNFQQEPDSPILQGLETVDRLLITKHLHVKSILLLRGKRNRYLIKSEDQNLMYTVDEETSWWIGYLCYGLRPLRLRVLNEQGVEVMRLIRPYACTTRVMPCQLQTMKVYSPPGTLLGTIEQQWSPVKPVYVVKNTEGADLFWLRGPLMTISLFKDVEFDICRPDGAYVGSTRKRWQGLTHALFFATIRDRFGVAFERDLTPCEKALLLAMTLLVDYMYYDT